MASSLSFSMTRIPAKFSRFNFPVDHNCLHLGISKSASSQFFGDRLDGYSIVSLITGEESTTSEDQELFVCLQILEDDLVKKSVSLSQVSECPDTITLYATDTFHKHYKIEDHEDVYIRAVKAFPLSKVVFGARTSRCYEWSKKRLFSTGLLVSACQQRVLVRSNDRFLAPVIPVFSGDEAYSLANYSDLITLECEPVLQGIISVNTTIIITDMSTAVPTLGDVPCRDERHHFGSSRACSHLPEPRIMSDFAVGMLDEYSELPTEYSDSGTVEDILTSDCTGKHSPMGEAHKNEVLLKPILMPVSFTHLKVFGKTNDSSFDEQCELAYKIGVTKDTLDRLHAFNGSWVVVSMAENTEHHGSEEARDNEQRKAYSESNQGLHTAVPDSVRTIQTSTPKAMPGKLSARPLLPVPLSNTPIPKKDNKMPDISASGMGTDQPSDPPKELSKDASPKQKRSHLAQIYVVNQKTLGVSEKRSKRNGAHVPFGRNDSPDVVIQNDAVALSPHLWFNIQEKPSQLIQLDALISVKLASAELEEYSSVLVTSRSVTTSCKPPCAAAVHLSLVKSPHYPMTSQFDEAIKKYFSTTRLLSVGDVISISTREFPEFTQDIGEGGGHRLPCVFLRVNKITSLYPGGMSYLVNSLHTSVYQEGPAGSYVPVTAEEYLNNKLDPIWASPLPPGICKYSYQLEQLILPFLLGRSQCDRLPPSVLLTGPVGCGKATVVKAVSRQLNMHCVTINCYDLMADTAAAAEIKIRNAFFKAGMSIPCLVVMRNLQALGKDRDGSTDDTRVAAYLKETIGGLSSTYTDWPMVVIATAPSSRSVAVGIQTSFLHHLEMETLTEQERCDVLQALCEKQSLAADVEIPHIAKRTAGMVLGDMAALHAHTVRAALSRIVSGCSVGSKLSVQEEKDICAAGVQIHQSDFEVALSRLQSAHADSIGAPKIPTVSWDDVGGLSDVKAEILDTIQLPLQHPELFAAGLRRSGVLLFGPPGTGKTLLAKAVATECSLNFLSVKGPELINMYVGQSEENVREVFVRARSASPCVIFFDELDSLAPNRGRSGDSGGVMDRVVSQLLAELDGLHKSADVFVIGATNRPDLLDPALLRPGRFDKLLYLGVSEDKTSQTRILHALTRKFNLSPGLSLHYIADCCPQNLTGADFYALCSDAMLGAIKRKISVLQEGGDSSGREVVVEECDFMEALDRLVPSISEQELMQYKQIQTRINRGL